MKRKEKSLSCLLKTDKSWVKCHRLECEQLIEHWKDLMNKLDNDQFEEQIRKERQEWRQRRQELKTWERFVCHQDSSLGDMEMARLCENYKNGDECWYQGNLDRVNEIKLYRLKGTDDYFICDVCYENGEYGELYDFSEEDND